jgi:hypothetical protein
MNLAAAVKAPAVDTPVRAAQARPVQRRIDDNAQGANLAGRCACGGQCPTCQARSAAPLSISSAGDHFEREADRAADSVASTLHGRSAIRVVPSITPFAPAAQAVAPPASTAEGAVMRAGDGPCAPAGLHDFAARLDANGARGEPLSPDALGRMESGFGIRFGAVRVHTDHGADALARTAGARAFAAGNHIYFRSGEYRPGTSAGDWLLAHELTHVAQQRAAPGTGVHRVQRVPSLAEAWAGATATVRSGAAAARETVSSGAHTLRQAAGTVRDAAVDVARTARALVEDYLEKHAPGVLAFLRGDIVAEIRQRVYDGLDSLFSGLGQRVKADGLSKTARAVFGEFVDGVSQVANNLSGGGCESLFAAMRMIGAFGERLTGPVFRELRDVARTVGAFFSDLWKRFGAPAADAIQSMAGKAWTWITEKAEWLWAKTEGVRRWFREAWEAYKRRFNLAWDDAAGVLASLRKKAGEAWDQIKRALGPWLRPLQVAAAALLLLTPLGPVVAIATGGYALWKAIGWIRAHWNDIKGMVVTARQYLHDHVLAPLLQDLNWLQTVLGSAQEWIAEKAADLAAALTRLIDALGLTPVLKALRRVLGAIGRAITRAVGFLAGAVSKLFGKLRQIAARVHRAMRPFYGLITAVLLFPQFPFLLPIVLAGWAWRKSPDCIKPPIIDFALDMIIAGVRALPEFKNFGEAWAQVKARIVRSLVAARAQPTKEKVRVANRVALMMTGEDISWIGNLVEAARKFPPHFPGQAQEELIGMNLGAPLPFERISAPEAAADADPQAALGAALAESTSGPRLDEGGITVDRVAHTPLEPEVEQELLDLGAAPGSTLVLDDGEGGTAAVGNEAPATAGPAAPVTGPAVPAKPLTQEEEAEAQLDDMIAQEAARPHDCKERPSTGPTTPAAVPELARIGPLTQAQRGRYLLNQVGRSMSQWFGCNAYWVIPVLIVAIVAFIAAFILTDGAILPAAAELMEVLGPVFFGIGILRITAFVVQYFAQAVAGDTDKASKSLARAFAAGAIEIAFALLFNLNTVIRQAGSAVRKVAQGGIRGARQVAGEAVTAAGKAVRGSVTGAIEAAAKLRGTVRTGAAAVAKNTGRAARFFMRGGRVVLRAIEDGFARGIRSLRGLFRRIREWFRRFKRFRVRFQGFLLIFEGEVNPWIEIFRAKIQVSDKKRAGARFLSEEELAELRRAQKPGTGRIREGEAVAYRETRASGRGIVGDRLTGDHIPSRAALERSLLDRETARLNRELTEAEIAAIKRQAREEGVTVVLRDVDHQTLSRTYAGRNTAVQIAADAADLGEAFRRDAEAILSGLKRDGRLNNRIVGAYLEAYRKNVARGIFTRNPAIDRMIENFIR